MEVNFTDILKELRKEHHMTQEDVAKILHISRPMYGHFERGKCDIPPQMLSDLADIFGTSTDYILGRTGNSEPYPPRGLSK